MISSNLFVCSESDIDYKEFCKNWINTFNFNKNPYPNKKKLIEWASKIELPYIILIDSKIQLSSYCTKQKFCEQWMNFEKELQTNLLLMSIMSFGIKNISLLPENKILEKAKKFQFQFKIGPFDLFYIYLEKTNSLDLNESVWTIIPSSMYSLILKEEKDNHIQLEYPIFITLPFFCTGTCQVSEKELSRSEKILQTYRKNMLDMTRKLKIPSCGGCQRNSHLLKNHHGKNNSKTLDLLLGNITKKIIKK